MDNHPLEPRGERTFSIIGAAMEVHRVLGSGFLEVFYRDARAIEFGLRSVPFASDVPCKIAYKGNQLRGYYRKDFVGTGHHVGLLLNFGTGRLEYKRFVLTKPRWSVPQTGI